jgi:hypothetical protein
MKVLIVGDGMLGSCLKELNPRWDVLSRKQGGLNINDFTFMPKIKEYDVIINCIAYTNTYDNDRDKHWNVNYEWVDKLVEACNVYNKKLVHISTDYVYANSHSNASEESVPVHHNSWYGYTKLLSDAHVQLKSTNYLLVRCGFKPTPFPYDEAPTIMVGNFDYVDTIAEQLTLMIMKSYTGLYNVGTPLKSMYDLAMDTKKDVVKTLVLPVKDMPTDVSMDLAKLKNSHL